MKQSNIEAHQSHRDLKVPDPYRFFFSNRNFDSSSRRFSVAYACSWLDRLSQSSLAY
jgi:hypothetical protein